MLKIKKSAYLADSINVINASKKKKYITSVRAIVSIVVTSTIIRFAFAQFLIVRFVFSFLNANTNNKIRLTSGIPIAI